MPDIKTGKYEEKILVLHSGKFTEANMNEQKEYQKSRNSVDYKGNHYRADIDGVWKKYNKEGKLVYEYNLHGTRPSGSSSIEVHYRICFERHRECFYGMKMFSFDEDNWEHVYSPNGGGIQIVKWCKKEKI
ncbi:MAG: hypothetical protein HY919_02695 [Elusimicrobia bacterium]|nr:hypothetical protein [Elusimicrobiota bacterium]